MNTLTLEVAAGATHAHVLNGAQFPSHLRVVTDTRSIQPGDTFLALRGEHFDGHAFVRDAVSKGAAAVVVEDAAAVGEGIPALVVADTKRAYMDLAAAARERFRGRVIAVTGSAGKTTTKHLLAQLLSAHLGAERVLATAENENNEIGVSKLLLSARSEHRTIVVEMGARHEGEIAQLAEIARPHAGILTNVGDAHMEIFGSAERLARTKWGLFSTGAQAILNARDAVSVARAPSLAAPPLWFGVGEPSVPGVWVRDERTLLLTYAGVPDEHRIDVRLPGAHNRSNLAAALSAALVLGVPLQTLMRTIPELTLPRGRYEDFAIDGGVRLIYDAYNANASGMTAALDAFAAEKAERRIAVLASMAELGPQSAELHEHVGAHAAGSGIHTLLAGGEYASSLAAGAAGAGFPRERIVIFQTNGEATAWIRENTASGDAVLLKGSRRYRMEEILSALGGAPS